MDNYTTARFAQAYEQPIPEDHPRCEDCGEPLNDDEQSHLGPNQLCNNCGTQCHGCDDHVWNEHLRKGIKVSTDTGEHKIVEVCKWCHDEWTAN